MLDSDYLQDTHLDKLIVVKEPRSQKVYGYMYYEDTSKYHVMNILVDLVGYEWHFSKKY